MSDSPASILFDEFGTPIATVSGVGGVRVGVDTDIDVSGLATETTLSDIKNAVGTDGAPNPGSGVVVAGISTTTSGITQIASISDGNISRLAVDTVGTSTIDVGLGLVPGSSLFGGFGERNSVNESANGVDIWLGAADIQPIPNTAGEAMSVVSTSSADTSAGTGTRTLEIHYLDAAGDKQTEEVTMNGTTPVSLAATNVRFVQFMHSGTVGSNGVAEGDVTVYKNGAPATVYNIIKAGGNMTLTSARMVPVGKKCLVDSWHCTESKDKKVAFRLRSTDSDGILHEGVFIFKDAMYLTSSAMQAATGFVAPALSIIKVSGWAPVTGAEAACSWSGTLVDE